MPDVAWPSAGFLTALPDFYHGKAMEPPKDASQMQAFFSKLPAFLAEFPNDKARRPAGGLEGAARFAELTSRAHASAPSPVTRVGVEGCNLLQLELQEAVRLTG
jgi:hypothetical protein